MIFIMKDSAVSVGQFVLNPGQGGRVNRVKIFRTETRLTSFLNHQSAADSFRCGFSQVWSGVDFSFAGMGALSAYMQTTQMELVAV